MFKKPRTFGLLWAAVVLLSVALEACEPTATAEADPASFRYVETAKGVELVADGGPMVEGFADVFGEGLIVDSPYCVVSCEAGSDWIVELDLPPTDSASGTGGSYGLRVVVPVVAGEVIGGQAVVSLVGHDKSFQAELRLR